MNKRDLIVLRDGTSDPGLKKALRYAIERIEAMEARLVEVQVLARSLQRAAAYKDDE